MNGVIGMAELLDKTKLDTRQKSFVRVVINSANSLLGIINDILDFSKIEAGKLEIEEAAFDLHNTISDVTSMLAAKVSEKDLELILRIAPDLPRMFVGDRNRIRQILTNLINNAVKFTEQGHILVELEGVQVEGCQWILSLNVADTGVGIPEDKQAAIFEQFTQVDGSSSRKHEGTGLGLAITTRLIELMNGKISISSKVGEGSTFRVKLSLEASGTVQPVVYDVGDLANSKILVVDDNPVNQKILEEQLHGWQIEAVSCNNASEALAFLSAAASNNLKLDAIILDYHMPEMTGEEMVEKMRLDERICNIPILLLTSVDFLDSGKSFSNLGFEAVLHKPVIPSDLLEALGNLVIANREANLAGIQAVKTLVSNTEPHHAAIDSRNEEALTADSGNLRAMAEAGHSNEDSGILDVLIAEDNEVNQMVFDEAMRNSGLKYKIVSDGAEAVKFYKALKPKVICMDVSMPILDGLQATRKIRDLEVEYGFEKTPIVAVTAHALNGDMERCFDGGMDDYLTKPFTPELLLEKIRSWLPSGSAAALQ
ncbi:MAG: response regulator [Pseudomonadota bacterium]